MNKPVGFDQKIVLNHLEITAKEARFKNRNEMYEMLDEYLKTDIKGDKSRKNAITILMKIWYLVGEENENLKQQAFELFNILPQQKRIILHWGMTFLAYPFFKDVADEIGNLIKLQNEVPSQQLGRRIKMLYGDRRRVEVAINAVLSSMKSWGILDLGKKNVYTLTKKTCLEDTQLKNWLLQVILRVNEYKTIPLNMITALTMFFPFDINININEVDTSIINVNRQGLDTYVLSI